MVHKNSARLGVVLAIHTHAAEASSTQEFLQLHKRLTAHLQSYMTSYMKSAAHAPVRGESLSASAGLSAVQIPALSRGMCSSFLHCSGGGSGGYGVFGSP